MSAPAGTPSGAQVAATPTMVFGRAPTVAPVHLAAAAVSFSSARMAAAVRRLVSSRPAAIAVAMRLTDGSHRAAAFPVIPLDRNAWPDMLLLGERDFSFAKLLRRQFPSLGFIATEYESWDAIGEIHCWSWIDITMSELEYGNWRQVLFGVDARKIHCDARLHPSGVLHRYRTVCFNMPHAGKDEHDVHATPTLVRDFFQAVKIIQHSGDEVRMALVNNQWHLNVLYDIATASHAAGYWLKWKKPFWALTDNTCYQHHTNEGGYAESILCAFEFCFVKGLPGADRVPITHLINTCDLYGAEGPHHAFGCCALKCEDPR